MRRRSFLKAIIACVSALSTARVTDLETFRKAHESAWRIRVIGNRNTAARIAFYEKMQDRGVFRFDDEVIEVARFFRMPPSKLGVISSDD